MRVLVTGGCGFLGTAFAARARGEGHVVLTLDRAPEADMVVDVGDPGAVAEAVRACRPDAAVHLAAVLTDAAADDPVAATRVNALGTAALFSACVAEGIARVIYASSNAAVVYGATKAFGEHLARAMSETGPTAFLALRFGWVYGPGRVRGWRVAQDLVEQFARGETQIFYPDMQEAMDWTYVDDAAEVLRRALGCPLGPFTACNVLGDRRSIGEAVAHLQHRFPHLRALAEPARAPASGWGLRNDGLKDLIGFEPATRLEDGLDRLLAELAGGSVPAG
ncbi:MAG: NAD(P)-dependent oxidoreductase [Acetobacteraceae bacterium]|nr:NAD(P)-dependent oxidoreductase [Acetobacteraceae bacterium]